METVVATLLPRIVPGVTIEVRRFNGKPDLLKKLPARLRGYASWLGAQAAVVVVVDRDADDCQELKRQLVREVEAAGLAVCSVAQSQPGQVLPRIAVEELEAWYLGDVGALRQAYSRISQSLSEKKKFRDPDAIGGGTAEALEHELRDAGYHAGGLRKLTLAQDVAPHMSVTNNRSASFQAFVAGVRYLVEGAA